MSATQEERLAVVRGVLDLMRSASRWAGEGGIEPDAILPHHNGYSMWFIGLGQIGTAPLSPEEILARIDARAALSSEDATRPTPSTCLKCGNRSVVAHGGGFRCRDCGQDATRPTGDGE